MTARPPRALYDAVNALSAERVAEVLGLTKARERGKYACPACPSSDALHAYRGDGRGFYCFACGTAMSAVDAGIAVWGLDHAGACQRLADAFGLAVIGSAPLPYRPPPASRVPTSAAESSVKPSVPWTHPALDALRVTGVVPQLPPAVYGAILDAVTLTADGAAYLRGRGIDPDAASDYGFRSIDGAREWAALGDALAGDFHAGELEAASLYRETENSGENSDATAKVDGSSRPESRKVGESAGSVWAPPWGGYRPALLMPYRVAGQVVAIQCRDLTVGGDKKLRYRALIPYGAHRPPFNADAIADCTGDVLHVVEGELNAFTLMQAGARAVGLKAAVWPPEWTARVRDVRRLVVWFDLDKGSERKAATLGGLLQASHGAAWVAQRTRRVPLPLGPDGRNLDANDLHLRGVLRDYTARAAL